MITKKWVSKPTGYTPLMLNPEMSRTKLTNLSYGAVVDATGETLVVGGITWERAVCVVGEGKNFVGWIQIDYLDLYVENLPKNCVYVGDIQTPNPADAEQYVLWKKYKQVNLCGELAICYLLGIQLSQLLTEWEVKKPAFYKRIFGGGMARGTGDTELIEMALIFQRNAHSISNLKYYSPNILKSLIPNVIVGCKIDSSTGRLRGQGVGHWVVVTGLEDERTGYGFVYLYNPFPNKIERYSWAEFIASTHNPCGIVLT